MARLGGSHPLRERRGQSRLHERGWSVSSASTGSRKPDRVPVHIEAGMLPLALSGLDHYTCLHHPDKAVEAWRAFSDEHAEELDCYPNIHFFSGPGAAFDLLDHKMWSYPGHGMESDKAGLQFVEGEYMLADEYDALIGRPLRFLVAHLSAASLRSLRAFEQPEPSDRHHHDACDAATCLWRGRTCGPRCRGSWTRDRRCRATSR